MPRDNFWTRKRTFRLIFLVCVILFCETLASSCSQIQELVFAPPASDTDPAPTAIVETEEKSNSTAAALPDKNNYILGLTHQRLDGNHFVEIAGGILDKPFDIPLHGKPIWIVAVPFQGLSIWYVVLENGQVQAFQVDENTVLELEPTIEFLPSAIPPVLVAKDDQVYLSLTASHAPVVSSPIVLNDGTRAYIDDKGNLHLDRSGEETSIPVDALPDARILSDEAGRLLFLSHPTTSYSHGALGDDIEAAKITLVDTSVHTVEIKHITIADGDVIEGIAPIWADIDLDGSREIIVTQSNASVGSRIVVYREDGTVLAEGEPIGKGFRWIHQIVAAQFISGGPLEIVGVRTPHIGGVVELYRLNGDRLEIVDTLDGYSSHHIGTRNLDGALAADLNGDGLIELIVPDQPQMSLSGIQLVGNQLSPVWNLILNAKLSSNLVIVRSVAGHLTLGAGTERQTLRLWSWKE